MDRDIALQMIDVMDDIKTALETIATNTTPATTNASVSDSRSTPVEEETETTPVEEVRKTTKK